jgi:hypothetical protein
MADYVALEEIKNTLELSNLTYADNDIRLAITAASVGMDNHCDRQFSTGGTVEARVFTPYQPTLVEVDDLLSVTTVQSDYDGDGVYETTWAATDYILWPFNAPSRNRPYEEIRIHPRPSFTLRFSLFPGSVKVTGQFGWSAVPPGVKQATTIMAIRLLRRTRDATFGVVGTGFDGTSFRIPKVDPDLFFLVEDYVKGGGVMVA